MSELIGADLFRDRLKSNDARPTTGVFRVSTGVEPKAYDDGSRKVRFCFSDGSVDRMGDTIAPEGWQTYNFLKNPVALFAHDSSAPPVGRASNLMVEDSRLMGDIEFATADIYAFADTIYRLVVGKFLNAVSVGFLPLEYDWSEEDGREFGIDFRKQELLEISVVPVPANGHALVDARSKGIDTRPLVEWAERTLEGGGRVLVPRNELEQLRRNAKEPKVTRTRARSAPRRRADETDPEAEATIGNCGRPLASECGMKDVSECSIHGNNGGAGLDDGTDDDAKRIQAIVNRAVKAALKAAARRRATDDAESDQDDARPALPPEHEKSIRMCSMHMKAMGDCLDVADEHHEKAMDALDSVTDALDASPPPSPAADDEDQEAKARRMKRLAILRARAA